MGIALDEPLPYVGLIALCTVALVLISSVTFLVFEKPGIALGKKLARGVRLKREGQRASQVNEA